MRDRIPGAVRWLLSQHFRLSVAPAGASPARRLAQPDAHTKSPRLLVAIHDVSPKFEREVEQLRRVLARYVSLDRVAMLVVPDHWGNAPLVRGSAFAARLRDWADDGGDVFVHGWLHRDDSVHADPLTRLKARLMTAAEGEFLGLNAEESRRRMQAGRALIEDLIGRDVAGFIAPAWLYGTAARLALSASDFALAEDHRRVWCPTSGTTLCTGVPITWATRSQPRILSSLLAARVLPPLLARNPVVRMAVHPGDCNVPRVMRSIERVLDDLATSRKAINYRDLLAA